MKAIRRIEIQNFQSHADTALDLADAGELTVLTGATDSGKSAVFRALRWLYYGGPVYIRTGQTAAGLTVRLDDGTSVTRQRSGSVNRYVVERPGEEPQVYEGFGRDIPLEVQQALGVRPLDIAGLTLEVNLARQHDPAFLVTSVSAPVRAKALGQIAGVEAVDLAIKSAGRDIFDGQRELKQVEAEAAALEEQVRQYDYLPALAERIKRVEELVGWLEAAEGRKDRLASIKSRLEAVQSQQAQWEAVRRRTAGAASALSAIDRAQGHATRRSTLERISRSLTDCVTREAEARAVVARTAGAAQAVLLATEAERWIERRRRLGSIQGRLARIDADRAQTSQRAEALSSALTAMAPAIEEAERRIERRLQFRSIRDRLAKTDADHARMFQSVASLSLALAAATPAIKEAEAKLHRLSSLRRIAGTFQHANDARTAWERKRDEAREAAQAARDAYTRALAEAGRCPTCGGPIDHEHLKEVV